MRRPGPLPWTRGGAAPAAMSAAAIGPHDEPTGAAAVAIVVSIVAVAPRAGAGAVVAATAGLQVSATGALVRARVRATAAAGAGSMPRQRLVPGGSAPLRAPPAQAGVVPWEQFTQRCSELPVRCTGSIGRSESEAVQRTQRMRVPFRITRIGDASTPNGACKAVMQEGSVGSSYSGSS
jgi:hypothetical protein